MYNYVNPEIAQLLKEKDERFDVISILDCPTISDVLMWLYEEKGIWINVRRVWDDGEIKGFEATIDTIDGFYDNDMFNTLSESYSDAILYTLKNLI